MSPELGGASPGELGAPLTGTGTERILRDQLRPRFPELARCQSTEELQASPCYRQVRHVVDRVLESLEAGRFATPAPPAKPSYRIVAWNLERGIQFDGQLQALRSHPYMREADVLLLTETDTGMARSGNRNVARDLAWNLGLDYVFAPCYLNLGKGAGVENDAVGENELGLHGNAVLSRYPILCPRSIGLGNGRDKMLGREKRIGQQVALAAEIALPGLEVTVCSTHLDAQSRQSHRRDQMRAVLDALPATGPAVIGGDWNTTTFNSSSATSAIVGYWVRLLLGPGNTIRNHFLRPYRFFERDLFRLLEQRGFDWRTANRIDERTTSYDVNDAKTYRNLREWVPEWCFDFIRWALREHNGRCPLKIDWFAVRDVQPEAPAVIHEFREGRQPPLSDHDPIGLEIRAGRLPGA